MRKPVIIVTGSSGYIGREVCVRLVRDGYHVVGFDRPGAPHPPPEAENIPCDLTSDAMVHDGIERVRREHGTTLAGVIHLSAYYDFSGEPSPLYEELTVRGTQRLLRELRNFQVELFAFASTELVHAPCHPGQRINEDWPLLPKWDYPESKVEAERAILAERGGMKAALLRIAGVYDNQCHSLPLANQMQRIYERRLTGKVYPGDIHRGQVFVHFEDVMDLIRRVVERRGDLADELTLLVGEDETLSYDELQRMFAWLIHGDADWDTAQIPKAIAKTGAWVQDKIPGLEDPFIKPWMIDLADDHHELDITRASKAVQWRPQRTLRETLRPMVDFLKSGPSRFYRENKLEGPPQEGSTQRAKEVAAHV